MKTTKTGRWAGRASRLVAVISLISPHSVEARTTRAGGLINERPDTANGPELLALAAPPTPLNLLITVGERCGELLYEVTNLSQTLPSASNFTVYGGRSSPADDRGKWRGLSGHKSLAQSHPELRALTDADRKRPGMGRKVKPAIGEPAEWIEGFPVPRGARRNTSLGGSTTLAPGRNYMLRVYDTGANMGAITAFYRHHLPDAKLTSEGGEVKFSKPGGHVRLAPLLRGTRITFNFGPR